MKRSKRSGASSLDGSATSSQEAAGASSRRGRVELLAVILAGLAAFAPSLRNELVFDDRGIILENPLVTGHRWLELFRVSYWGHLRESYVYRPLTVASFTANHFLGGADPAGFHAVNIVLHAAVCALLYLVLRRVFPRSPAIFFAAALFALHPVHAEAVASVVGRGELLAAGFVLAALLVHLSWDHRLSPVPVSALFAVALISKETAVALGPALLLADLLRQRDSPKFSFRELARRVAPTYAAIAGTTVGWLLLRRSILGASSFYVSFLDNPVGRSPAVTRIATGIGYFVTNLRLMVWPQPLSADYSYAAVVPLSAGSARFGFGALLLAGIVFAAWKCWRRDNEVAFGLLLLLASWLPVSNIFFPIGTVVAERLLYIPSMGIALVAGRLLARLLTESGSPALRPGRVATTLLILGTVCLPVAWSASNAWKDDESLWRAAVAASPRSAKAQGNLASVLLGLDRNEEARESLERALAILPSSAESRGNLGLALLRLKRPTEAARELEKALVSLPDDANARVNLSKAKMMLGDRSGAKTEIERAIAKHPSSADAVRMLGTIELAEGRWEEAAAALERTLSLGHRKEAVYRELAWSLERLGKWDRAAEVVQAGLVAAGESAGLVLRRGAIEAALGKTSEAAASLERAVALAPDDAEIAKNAGAVFHENLRDDVSAERLLLRSLELAPAQRGVEDLKKLLAVIRARPDSERRATP